MWDELARALNADLMLAAPVTGEQCDTKSRILKKEEDSKMCDMLKRMHEDKIKMFGSFLEVFKKLSEKDI